MMIAISALTHSMQSAFYKKTSVQYSNKKSRDQSNFFNSQTLRLPLALMSRDLHQERAMALAYISMGQFQQEIIDDAKILAIHSLP